MSILWWERRHKPHKNFSSQDFEYIREERDRALEMFALQRDEYRGVLENIDRGILVFDTDLRLRISNSFACSLFRISPENIGKKAEEIFRSFSFQEFVMKAQSGEDLLEQNINVGYPEQSILFLRAIPLSRKNERYGTLVFAENRSEEFRFEQIRKDFVANVAHEFRTPLTTIKGFVETLLDGAVEQPEYARRFLQIVDRHVERLNGMVASLLTLSQAEASTCEILAERTLLDVQRFAENVAEHFQEVCAHESKKIHLNIEPGLFIFGHQGLCEVLLYNLIENAMKASNQGDEVSVVGKQQGADIVLSVVDRGCGIPSQHVPRIFERFYRVDGGRSRRDGGVGLGLSLVKHILHLHQGRIEVESTVGSGSTFRAIFQAADTTEQENCENLQQHVGV